MRKLTLNEKISIRAILSKFDIPKSDLIRGDMNEYLFYWSLCCRGPISRFYVYYPMEG